MKKLFTLLLIGGIHWSHAQHTITLKPGTDGNDSYTHSAGLYQADSFWDDKKLVAGTWTYNGDVGTHRFMIDFDWSQIPAGATITGATLKLYAFESVNGDTQFHSTLSGTNNGMVNRIAETWDETTLTHLNKPVVDPENGVAIPASTSTTQDYSINVTQLVQDMFTTCEKFGFAVKLVTEVQYRRLSFCSSNHPNAAKHPELVVTYTSNAALDELNKNPFSVYPNPAKNVLTVKSDLDLYGQEYTVTDLGGRNVLKGTLNKSIDVSSLESAVYLLVIDGKTVKFAVQ